MSLKNNQLLRFRGIKINSKKTVSFSKAVAPTVANSRALIISCNYPGQPGIQLNGCWEDADLFEDYLKQIDPNGVIVRMKDEPRTSNFWNEVPGRTYQTHYPTTKNIRNKLDEFVKGPEKVLFLYFSGHGGLREDKNKDELEQVDANSSYVPLNPVSQNTLTLENPDNDDGHYFSNDFGKVSFARSFILDDYIYTKLLQLKSNQTCYIFTDICHSGTVADLPYINVADYTNALKDPSGNDVYDDFDPPNKKCWPDISNIVLTTTDISNFLTTYATNAGFNLKFEVQPKKAAKEPAAKIIHFGGTRSQTLCWESQITNASGEIVVHGSFTWALNRLLTYGANKLTLRQFFTCLTGLINKSIQIPVCSTSKKSVLDISGYLVTLNDPSKAPKIVSVINAQANRNSRIRLFMKKH